MPRVAVIGDIGGHRDELAQVLTGLSADPEAGTLPEDLTVVQVGDLIHRGPDSAGVIALVENMMAGRPGGWVQLVGNHEAQYLTRRPRFAWDEQLGPAPAATLRRWWHSGRMRLAVAVTGPAGDWLITHAGLTRGFWASALGRPPTAAAAARALNRLIDTDDAAMFRGGRMIEGRVNPAAGPIWADAADEVAASWLTAPDELPFSQIHGHSSLFDWQAQRWRAAAAMAALSRIDLAARHVTVRIGRFDQVGIDPGFGVRAGVGWRPFVLDDSRILG